MTIRRLFAVSEALVFTSCLLCGLALVVRRGAKQKEASRKSLEDEIQERRRTEAALRESEEHYRIVTESATDGIITIDEDSTIQFSNPAAERIFGHTIAKMSGQSLTMLVPEYRRHVHLAGIDGSGSPCERHIGWNAIPLAGLHESGKEIPLELSFGEFRKDGKLLFTGIVRDISERKQAEKVLRQSEEQYRLLFSEKPASDVGLRWGCPVSRRQHRRVPSLWILSE